MLAYATFALGAFLILWAFYLAVRVAYDAGWSAGYDAGATPRARYRAAPCGCMFDPATASVRHDRMCTDAYAEPKGVYDIA